MLSAQSVLLFAVMSLEVVVFALPGRNIGISGIKFALRATPARCRSEPVDRVLGALFALHSSFCASAPRGKWRSERYFVAHSISYFLPIL